MVEDLGHEVIEVSSGSEALAQEEWSATRFGGKELIPYLPILLATGFAQLPDGGDVGLPRIAKPYPQEQLATAIKEILAAYTCSTCQRYDDQALSQCRAHLSEALSY
jgi:hypothetical protein